MVGGEYTINMKIEWNKVTWYSKLIALALFVALPFIGFYYGMQYGKMVAVLGHVSDVDATAASTSMDQASLYYSNPAEWQTDTNSKTFSIAYPIDFQTTDNLLMTPSADWSMNAFGTTGVKAFTLTVPKAFEPQTNFSDATLTVGLSANATAVHECLSPSTEGSTSAATTTINGVAFSVFHSSDAGAGNLYATTSYRTLHSGTCYAIEYTVHSSQIANYPASYNLQPLDEHKIDSLMQQIVGTFTFI